MITASVMAVWVFTAQVRPHARIQNCVRNIALVLCRKSRLLMPVRALRHISDARAHALKGREDQGWAEQRSREAAKGCMLRARSCAQFRVPDLTYTIAARGCVLHEHAHKNT